MSNKTKALTVILVAAILGGANSPYVKLAVNTIPPFTYTFIRFFLSLIIILPFFIASKPKFKPDDFKLVRLSLFAALNIILFSIGVKLTTASTGQVIYTFEPIVVAILSSYLIRERLTFNKITGIVIGFLGVNFVISFPLFTRGLTREMILGNIIILIGCISFSYYTVLSKKYLKKYSPLWLTVIFIFTTAVLSFILSFGEIGMLKLWVGNMNLIIVWAVFYTVLIGTVMAYYLNQYAIKYGSPLIASLIQYLSPGITMFWSNIILREGFSLVLVSGALITVFGAWLVTRES